MSLDRNQAARDRFASESQKREQQKLMQQFAQAVGSGQAGALDRFGNKIEAGHMVLLHPPYDYIYTVVEVAPMLAPNVPPGYVRLKLVMDLTMSLQVNQPTMTLIVVGKKDDAGASKEDETAAPIAPPPMADDAGDEPAGDQIHEPGSIIDPRD